MSNLTAVQSGTIPALSMDENQLITVLENSLYPGANPTSIALVINYCRASQLDPMQKPVHIVPIWDGKAKTMRDVIMPGIGLYRTQAARSGLYAGVSDPDFGPDITEKVGGLEITYPQWCRVSVKRTLPDGQIAEFSATERWKENYAQKGGAEKSVAPNAMWARRPYAQLAKCAEAQALRKAFPELAGSQPTADEMEGKVINDDFAGTTIDGRTGEITGRPPAGPAPYPEADFEKNFPAWEKNIREGKNSADGIIARVSTKGVMSNEQVQRLREIQPGPAPAAVIDSIRAKADDAAIADSDICAHLGIATLDALTVAQAEAAIAFIANPMGA